ncbi:MAG: 23S rRNA (uracil(1939)-C(5))-methyltransferase RlmD [Gracilibacteraceae bacterium]|jgi:23S rRNA (uracil1939-C5)-methyltransferase|nr:23S rRNA (uracil(1939)-C(5))-methyltransferase RlmD [Gracilibacteraceae bacterium]
MTADGWRDAVLLRAERLASDGSAVARDADGAAVFVPGLLPGEEALVSVVSRRRNYRRGEMRALLNAAPERREPRCPLFGRCGACHLQHMSYDAALFWKRRWLEDALRRIGGLTTEVEATRPAEYPWACRNKAVLHWDGGKLGFYASRSREIIDLTACALLPREMNGALGRIRAELAGREAGEVVLRRAQNGALACSLPGWADSLEENILGLRFHAGIDSFLQVNAAQTEFLYGLALEWAELSGRENVWDLYCGIGTISLPLALRAAHVTGVEENPHAVEDARKNARRNGINNIRFIAGKTERVLSAEFIAANPPDVAVADPPRGGLAPAATAALLAAAPRRLIYISCDPATLARDAARLAVGYRLAAVRPVDMFCQCADVECVSLFTRKQV